MPTLTTPARMLWILRGVWIALGPLGAGAVAHVAAAPWVTLVAWWVGFTGVLLALALPGAASLTATRLVAPLTVPAVAVAAVVGAPVAPSGVALGLALAAATLTLSGEVGDAFVQGSAYGDEQRFLLRAPAALATAVSIGWLVWATAVIGGISLAASRRWPFALVTLGAAALLTWPCGRALQRLSRRWLVVVPAGVVLHDHVVLGETLMVPRAGVRHIGLAPADSGAADLTGPASGFAVQIDLDEPVLVRFAPTRAEARGRAIHAAAVLTAPVRPGRALNALARRLPVG